MHTIQPARLKPGVTTIATPPEDAVRGLAPTVRGKAMWSTLNAARKGLIVVNDSTAALYIAYAGTAGTSAYSYYVPGSQSGVPYTWEMPKPVFTGTLSCIWSSATGTARVTDTS